MTQTRKLIEVSPSLEAVGRESAREKSIRHGHPSARHLWWAPRSLAAARAISRHEAFDPTSLCTVTENGGTLDAAKARFEDS